MSDLIAIVYPTEAKAEQMRQKFLSLQKEYLVDLEDAVIAVKTQQGHVKLNQLISPTRIGALQGSFWGLIIGAIFLMPVVGPAVGALSGAALGAASGAIGGALSDLGIDDDFIKRLAANLEPGHAALFLLVRKMTAAKVLEAIKGTGGNVLRTSLDHSKKQALREAGKQLMTKRYRPPETYGGIERRSTYYPCADTGSESSDVGSISKERHAHNDASDHSGSYFPGRLGLGPNWHHTIRQPRSGKNARQFAVLDHDCGDGFGPLDLDPADLQLNLRNHHSPSQH